MRLCNSPARPVVFTAVVVIVMDAGILLARIEDSAREIYATSAQFLRKEMSIYKTFVLHYYQTKP